MKRIRLGSTGLKVSPFSFGTMTLGEPVNAETSLNLLDLVTDSGVNFIDTSNSYNAGRSEEIIGQWMDARNKLFWQRKYATRLETIPRPSASLQRS